MVPGMEYFLLIFLAVCLLLAYYLGRSPVRRTVETQIVGKRVKFQESITPSGNTYVPVKSEVYSLDTEITYDVPVSKVQWDRLDKVDRIELNLHLNGEYSFKRRVKG